MIRTPLLAACFLFILVVGYVTTEIRTGFINNQKEQIHEQIKDVVPELSSPQSQLLGGITANPLVPDMCQGIQSRLSQGMAGRAGRQAASLDSTAQNRAPGVSGVSPDVC